MLQGISRHKSDTKAAIAFGSNVAVGNQPPHEIVKAAFSAVETETLRLLTASRLYATPCMPAGAGPDYVNAVGIYEASLGPHELLAHLHAVERGFDRQRTSRWAARTLDIDLLDLGGLIRPDPQTWQHWHDMLFEEQRQRVPEEIILPHPRIQDRAFVLVPLAEVAPGWRHPVLGRTAADLRAGLTGAVLAGITPI